MRKPINPDETAATAIWIDTDVHDGRSSYQNNQHRPDNATGPSLSGSFAATSRDEIGNKASQGPATQHRGFAAKHWRLWNYSPVRARKTSLYDHNARHPSICVSPSIDIACPEIVLPRGLHMNRIWSASCCGVT